MSKPERIYALLVEANPVSDPDALPDVLEPLRPRLEVVDPRRDTMQTEERPTELRSQPTRARRPIPAIATLVAVIVVVVAAAVLFRSGDSTAPADPSPAPNETDRNTEAVAKTVAFFAALNAGDMETVATLTRPDDVLDEADRNLWEWDIVFSAAGYPYEATDCHALPDAPEADLYVTVECSMSHNNPVVQAAGLASEWVWPWWVWHGGRMDWQPDTDPEAPLGIYADFLKAHHPTDYESACNPAPYFGEGTAIHDDQGIAFTGSCAGLVVPLLDDMAQWVEDGRPAP